MMADGRPCIRVRTYRSEDAAALARLFHETVHAIAARDYTAAELHAWAPVVPDGRAWDLRLRTGVTLVAELDGAVSGFAALDPPDHLDLLYVHKDHQGRGVASALLAAIEARARAHGATRLATEASLTARPFFAARGFVVVEDQTIERGGVFLRRFAMVKDLG
ncbi:MAG: GNAT family N-acetyltransferase [Alphaproteobacteria bacterium]